MPSVTEKSARSETKHFVLKLYVTGANRRSQRAIRNLNQICEEHLQGRYELEVVDLYQFPDSARDAEILAVPTLIREVPAPARRVIGDLSQSDRVLLLLDIRKR